MNKNDKIVIIGMGFIGSKLYEMLKGAGWANVTPVKKSDYLPNGCYLFNMTGYNGGINFNLNNKTAICYANDMTNLTILNEATALGYKKVISLGASCAYPSYEGFLKEESYLQGEPHPSVKGHAIAKRHLMEYSQLYSESTKTLCCCLIPTTVYGNTKTDLDKVKVLESLVIKIIKAKRDNTDVVLWGTGKPLREFIFIDDVCRLIIEGMLHYDDPNLPLNLGTGHELTIRELAERIAHQVKFKGRILFDETKPDGEYRKRLDLSRMNWLLCPIQFTPFEEGLRKTIEFYEEHLNG